MLRFVLLAGLVVLGCASPSTPVVFVDAAVDATDIAVDVAPDTATPDVVMDERPTFDVPTRDVAADVPGDGDAGTAADVGDAACRTLEMVPYAGRTSREEFTDPPSCSGCPGAFAMLDELDAPLSPTATTVAISGQSAGAQRCAWYVEGGDCGITWGAASTDPDGAGIFQATIPVFCGTNVVRVVCSNAAGSRVVVRRLEGTRCAGRDLRVTLTWDDHGTDMELHLVRPGGRINSTTDDCTWFTCMGASGLEWGDPMRADDNPRKDIDNTSYLGPENIFLDRAPAGTYHIVVEYWGGGTPSANAVDVTVRERTVARLRQPMLAVHAVWVVGSVTFPSGVFTPIERVVDCATDWRMSGSMGCPLALP